MSSVNISAVEAAIKAADPPVSATFGPLVELVRGLARQVDAAGSEGPSARLAAAYLSALRSFGKVVVADPADAAKPKDELEQFLEEHGIPGTRGVAS